jgi:hypothetical protein
MTEGLNVTTKSAALRELCLKRGDHHRAYLQKDRDTIEKRSGLWLKELAHQSQTTGFDLNAWIPTWESVGSVRQISGRN